MWKKKFHQGHSSGQQVLAEDASQRMAMIYEDLRLGAQWRCTLRLRNSKSSSQSSCADTLVLSPIEPAHACYEHNVRLSAAFPSIEVLSFQHAGHVCKGVPVDREFMLFSH